MLDVLFEDNHLIIVNKSCGEIVQSDKTGDNTLGDKVKEYIKNKYQKPGDVFLGTTHRLDRPTSGLVIFTRTSKALMRMNKLFADREIKKTYLAVTNNIPSGGGHLVHYLIRNRKQNKSYAHKTEKKDSKKAVLNWKKLSVSERYFLLEIDLETGRHHQIRAQFAAEDCFIKGDLKYGFPRSNKDGGIHLHAYKVEFFHPVRKEKIEIKAKPPNDVLWNSFKIIR